MRNPYVQPRGRKKPRRSTLSCRQGLSDWATLDRLLPEHRNVVEPGVRVEVAKVDIARPDTLLVRHHLHLGRHAEFLAAGVPTLDTGDEVNLVGIVMQDSGIA